MSGSLVENASKCPEVSGMNSMVERSQVWSVSVGSLVSGFKMPLK